MGLSPFRLLYGTRQGRVAPSAWAPAAGSYAYVLGSDAVGVRVRLAAGDYHQIAQTGDVTAVNFVRFAARLRGVILPAGLTWRFSIRVDGTETAARVLEAGRTVDLADVAANVSKLSGDHALAFRLALAGPAGNYEVELPGVYIDAVVLDAAAARPALINRLPEPGETSVPSNSTIAVQIVDPGVSGIDVAATSIYVNGALAFAGTQQAGFDGGRAALSSTSDTLSITLDPTTPFESSQVVTVRVVSRTVGGAGQFDTTYAFTVADFEAPRIAEAYAIGERLLRVVFSEEVQQADGAAALVASSYALSLLDGAPAVTPIVASVASESGDVVQLTTSIEMTPGATYRLTASGVRDLVGNMITAPNNGAAFTGYQCQFPDARDFDIWSWIPELNRSEDTTGDLRAFISCLQEVTDLMLCTIDMFVDILDPDFAPEDWLDLMLADLGNPFPFALDVDEKRRLVQALVGIYGRKGTDAGIVAAIRFFLGIEATIETMGWAPLGFGRAQLDRTLRFGSSSRRMKLSFRVRVTAQLTDEQRKRITTIANYMKDARTHLIGITGPIPPVGPINHWALGRSRFGRNTRLH